MHRQMKRIYIKPEIEWISVRSTPLLKGSPNTQWNTGTEGQYDDTPVGPTQPDPNSDEDEAKGYDLWGTWD